MNSVAIHAATDVFLQNGKKVTRDESSKKPLCAIMTFNLIEFRDGDKLIMEKFGQDIEKNMVKISSDEGNLILICRKNEATPWTLKDLQEVYGETATITEIK